MIKYNDRANITDMFSPPAGARLAYCIGTTFTIDLPALIQGALATQSIGDYEAAEDFLPKGARTDALYSKLEDFSRKAVIFCHANRILNVPDSVFDIKKANSRTRLLGLLDEALVSVNAPNKAMKTFGAFHPKVWLLRFDDNRTKKAVSWRFIVASRNLTCVNEGDLEKGSWEVGICLNGYASTRPSKMNRNIGRFLDYLSSKCRTNRHRSIIKSAMADLNGIAFGLPSGFEEAEFLWSNRGEDKFGILDSRKYKHVVAVSPFLSKGCIDDLAKISKYSLITGEKDLRYLNNNIVSKSTKLFDMPEHALHAKLYICNKKDGKSDVFMGSANMTNSGLRGLNVEAMIKLSSGYNQIDRFTKDFIKPAENELGILSGLKSDDPNAVAESDEEPSPVEKFRRHLDVGNFIISRSGNGNGWMLSWEGEPLPDDPKIKATIKFPGIPEADLRKVIKQKIRISEFTSAFYVVEISYPGAKSERFNGIAIVEHSARVARSGVIHSELIKEAASLSELLQSVVMSDRKDRSAIWIHADDSFKEENKKVLKKKTKLNKKNSTHGLLELFLTADLVDTGRSEMIGDLLDKSVKARMPDAKIAKDLWLRVTRIHRGVKNEAA